MSKKLVLLLISTITLSLLLAGSLLAFLQHRVYQQETITKLYQAHNILGLNLQTNENNLIIQGAEISQNESIISSVNMITEYQDIERYQPIIFDEEKKKLVIRLSERVILADFDMIAIYDADGDLVTFSLQKDFGFLLGIISYQQAQPVIYLSGSIDRDSWTESTLPAMVRQKMKQHGEQPDTIQYLRGENGFSLLVTLPIVRMLADGTAKTIGFVQLSNFFGRNFVDYIEKQTQVGFQLVTADVDIGDLDLEEYADLLSNHSHSLLDEHNELVDYSKTKNYFLHSHSLQLHDGSHAHFIFSRDRKLLKAQLWNMQMVIFTVLVCTAVFCIPLGIYVARKTISIPIERLIKGVNALKKGSYETSIPVLTNGELGALAKSFNEMGQAIKQRQTGLERAKEEWERTFNSINDILAIQDLDFEMIQVNQATCDFLGKTRDEIIGKPCYQLFYNRDSPCLDCPTQKALKDYKSHSTEMINDTRQPTKNMLLSSSPIFDDLGECIGIVYSAKDITETKELANKLRQAQKMEAIGTLAGGIAHDFNNILTPILGYSEILMMSLPKGSIERENEKEVVKAAQRAKELVKQILTFSRETEHEQSPVQIHLIVKEALKLLRASLPANIEFKQTIATDCCQALADPTQIHQVLMNLCTNAYHAMRDTGGILTVTLSEMVILPEDYVENPALQAGKYLRLTVGDNGRGMTRDLVEKIFDPYFTTKKKGDGTGLGLSVVHGIIKNHRGHITVYSEPGLGSEFHVYLPCVAATASIHSTDQQQEIPLGSMETVLLVDDEKVIAEMLGNILEHNGYQVKTESDSAKALETFRQEYKGIDLVITDMSMPGMNGAELAEELLKIKPGLPIILCTGFSDIIDEQKAKASGFKGFLLKPVLTSQLTQAVKKALA